MARRRRPANTSTPESTPEEPRRVGRRRTVPSEFKLPTGRRAPVSDPWRFAYLLTGEKKIGKTSFAIQGSEELVFQFDKPQLAYNIREIVIESWSEVMKGIKALEDAATAGDFPYTRLIFDGVSEWYAMAQAFTCNHFGIEHPSDEGYAKGWHYLRDIFSDAVTRILRLQETANCGVVFIAHAEWKDVPVRSPWDAPPGAKIPKIEKLVPNLSSRCEEIVGGKVDGWFCYDYDDNDRIIIVQGNQSISAGHRIDGRFLTSDGRRVREIYAGTSAKEALENFISAFRNEWEFIDLAEWKKANREQPRPVRGRRSRRRSVETK